MKLRSILITGAAAAALAAGTMTPVQAAPGDNTRIDVTVIAGDTTSPLNNVGIELQSVEDEDFYLDLGETDVDGELSVVGEDDWGDALEAGEYTVLATDYDEDRYDDGTDYANYESIGTVTINEDETNVIPTIELVPGGKLAGKITAPSGRPVANAIVFAFRNGQYEAFRSSNVAGDFSVSGLREGAGYTLNASQVPNQFGNFGVATNAGTRSVEAGQTTASVNITNFKVRCTTGLAVSSPKKGQAKVTITSTAANMGIPTPGGKVVIKRGTKVLGTVNWAGRASATYTFKGQKKGKTYSYSATYTGGDCLNWAAAKSVKIKKK